MACQPKPKRRLAEHVGLLPFLCLVTFEHDWVHSDNFLESILISNRTRSGMGYMNWTDLDSTFGGGKPNNSEQYIGGYRRQMRHYKKGETEQMGHL